MVYKYKDLENTNKNDIYENFKTDNNKKSHLFYINNHNSDLNSSIINENSLFHCKIEFLINNILSKLITIMSSIFNNEIYTQLIKNKQVLELPYLNANTTIDFLSRLISKFFSFYENSINNWYQYSSNFNLLKNCYSNGSNLDETSGLQIGLEYISPDDYLLNINFNNLFILVQSCISFVRKISLHGSQKHKGINHSLEFSEFKRLIIKKLDLLSYDTHSSEYDKKLFLILPENMRVSYEYLTESLKRQCQ